MQRVKEMLGFVAQPTGAVPIPELEIKSKRNRLFFYIAAVFFLIFSFSDLDVFLLKIPDFKNLNISEGKVSFSPYSGKRGRSFLVNLGEGALTLNCWISSNRDKTCVKDHELKKMIGSPVKVWWYKAKINGFFTENRLLQLEVNGKIVISYETQKQKYLLSKKHHDYLATIFFVIFLLLSLASTNFKINKRI